MVQARKFAAEIKLLRPRDCSSDGEGILKRNSKTFQLDLFLDEDGVLHVGDRLHKSYLNDDCKHPVLLPKKERVTLLIMQWCHSKCAHGGRESTLNELQKQHLRIEKYQTKKTILVYFDAYICYHYMITNICIEIFHLKQKQSFPVWSFTENASLISFDEGI